MAQRIFLIGMPGSGKTFFGKRLTEVLNLPLFDLDAVITEQEGMPVTDLFSQFGEAHFRNLEKATLAQLIRENESFILSTGGGTPCFFDNMEVMKKSGITIFLHASEDLLIERISRNDKRPLMKDNVQEKVKELMSKRTPIYQQAHITMYDRDLDVLLPQLIQFFKN